MRLTLDYAHNPLVFHSASDNRTIVAVIDNILFGNLGAALTLWNRLSINVDLPVALVQTGPTPTFGSFSVPSPNHAHIADLRVGARVRLFSLSDGLLNLSLGGYIWLPLGASSTPDGSYLSDAFIRGLAEILVDGRRGRFVWGTAIGADIRRAQTFLGVDQGTMLRLNVGAAVLLLSERRLQIGPEIRLALTPAHVNRYNTNLEIMLGLRYFFRAGLDLGVATGPGMTSGIGTPDFRVVASLGYGIDFFKTRPPPPEMPAPAEAPASREVPASREAPTSLEVPASLEVAASLETRAEKTPPPTPQDTDGDAILDPRDACPQQAGPPNDDPKRNGCADGAVVGNQIVVLDPVGFKTASNKILPSSDRTLRAILATIQQLPLSNRFRVEGHTDSRGSAVGNRALSLARAKSVVRWLAAHGVDEHRFDAVGFGPDRPRFANASERGRRANRRIEIHIVTQ